MTRCPHCNNRIQWKVQVVAPDASKTMMGASPDSPSVHSASEEINSTLRRIIDETRQAGRTTIRMAEVHPRYRELGGPDASANLLAAYLQDLGCRRKRNAKFNYYVLPAPPLASELTPSEQLEREIYAALG